MDSETRKVLAGVIRTLASLLKGQGPEKPAEKPKPKARPAPPPLSELERVQKAFEFQRLNGGIMAEGRQNRYGEFEWRYRR